MTTKVTVEVPEHADYSVAITTNTPPLRGNSIKYLSPGERIEIYIHDGLRVVGIEEVPVPKSQLARSEVFTNPAPHSEMKVSKA